MSSSPVAICMTLTALPITSAGRFSPLGQVGIVTLILLSAKRTPNLHEGQKRIWKGSNYAG